MNSKFLAVTAALCFVFGAAGFYGGITYQKSQTPASFRGNNGLVRPGMMGRNNQNFRPVAGQVLNVDDKSMTVKLSDGSSRIVLMPENISVTEATSAAKSAIKTGSQVMIFGNTNADGSVTAQNIQLNQMMNLPGR